MQEHAFVELGGRRCWLGECGTPEGKEEYHRLLAEWEANDNRPTVELEVITIAELADRFMERARQYYGGSSGEAGHFKLMVRLNVARQFAKPERRP